MTEIDLDNLQSWVGRQETFQDRISPVPAIAMRATLDLEMPRPSAGDLLPALWHWLYFLPAVPASMLDTDGHELRGGFLPPVPLPGRVWGGSRITFHSPLHIGDVANKTSTIISVQKKGSDDNPLVIVTVQHDISVDGRDAIHEEQDIIYRDNLRSSCERSQQSRKLPEAQWSREVMPNSVLLFRFSALTFNSHRIHYDRDYATDSEGYPGLVVHGPLAAALLVAMLQAEISDRQPSSLSIRAERPLFDTAAFSINGRLDDDSATLWTVGPDGAVSMNIHADYAAR